MKLAPPLGFFPFLALSNEAVLHSFTRSDALLKKAWLDLLDKEINGVKGWKALPVLAQSWSAAWELAAAGFITLEQHTWKCKILSE